MALAFFPFNIIIIIHYIFRLYSPYILGCYTTLNDLGIRLTDLYLPYILGCYTT